MTVSKHFKKSVLVLFVLAISLIAALSVVHQVRAADQFPPVPVLFPDFPVEETPVHEASCEGSTNPECVSPGIWAADVCAGEDGHDANGWLTLDAATADSPYPPTLHVAAGPDGPWYATTFMQPPYIMSYADVDALVAWVGVAQPGDLWFKATEAGTPANLASTIADRAAHMDTLCGS